MKISIIGTGNVGYHLYKAFVQEGRDIEKIISRNPEKVPSELKVKAGSYDDISKLKSEVIILAVKDDVIEELTNQYEFPKEATLAHTSGATSINVFEGKIINYGVFYPLQTIQKDKEINYQELPIYLESNTEAAMNNLKELAKSITAKVGLMNSAQRLAAHIAAVFASNFTNHMLQISETILKEHKLEPNLLHPLVRETFEKALEKGPEYTQTGPALRKDQNTMKKHLEFMENEQYKTIYKLISESIQSYKT